MAKVLAVIATSLLALAAIGYFLLMGVGKPISSDLSLIGQDKPTLVLAYVNYSPTGGDALSHLRKVSSDYDSRLVFLVADMGTPEGLTFANLHKLGDGQAVFLKQDGQPQGILNIPADEATLRRLLDSKLAAIDIPQSS